MVHGWPISDRNTFEKVAYSRTDINLLRTFISLLVFLDVLMYKGVRGEKEEAGNAWVPSNIMMSVINTKMK